MRFFADNADCKQKKTIIERPIVSTWPSPTPEMLDGDPLFDAIWQVIKKWDINVPDQYVGYMGATGNHVRAIYEAVKRAQS